MKITRRSALRTMVAAPLGLTMLYSAAKKPAIASDPPLSANPLKLTIAGYQYDRVKALADGRVKVEGCDLTFEKDTIGNMNTDVFSGAGKRDVTEIGLHPFILAYANEGFRNYTLLPIFPLRVFRHKSIFIRTDRGISKPEDLRGQRIATPGYSSTSLTWIRGILESEYGVTPNDIKWVVSAGDSSAELVGKTSKQENVFPKDLNITPGPVGKDESDLLADGDVDALFHAAEPKCYIEGNPKVARLFPDFRTVERSYFEKTRIFPIMHAVAIRTKLIDEHPWLPNAVFKAYSQSKEIDYQYLESKSWAFNSLPWVAQEVEETQSLMGRNFSPYGVDANRAALETLCEFSFKQGLSKRRLKIEGLFHPSTLELKEDTV
ncbi:MAG: ABC transporter substrate-binding protein [Candidatus Dadabacteria bacterium]|jgi:4,5-dihydroxyphthalate decarboxylase